MEATYWTGYHGVAEEPRVVMQGTYAVKNGSVTVDMSNMDATAAYNITVTQASDSDIAGVVYNGSWRELYEAENVDLAGNAQIVNDPDGNFACSGRKQVQSLNSLGDSVKFSVTVPQSGYYKYDIWRDNRE